MNQERSSTSPTGSSGAAERPRVSKTRVLFVDDEQNVLAGLRALLRRQRREWEMVFAQGGQAAVEQLEQAPFDIVVTDMRMPGMDGAALLKHIKENYPATARVVLSGYADREAVLRVAPIAHQFLSKPCSANQLRAVIQRACNVQAIVNNETLKRAVGGMDVLPSAPRIYAALTQALRNEETGIGEVAAIIEKDPAISAKVLQIANSALFGMRPSVRSVKAAVDLLGAQTIYDLVVGIGALDRVADKQSPSGLSIDNEQAHALGVAKLAKSLLTEASQCEAAFLGGMLHDIGRLIAAARVPGKFADAAEYASANGVPIVLAEEEIIGFAHPQVGAYLLSLWGLPPVIVAIVAGHHCPGSIASDTFDPITAVHVANVLWHEVEDGETTEQFDTELLERQGVLDQIPKWRELAISLKERPPAAA